MMKKNYLILFLGLFVCQMQAQLLTLQSADSLNGSPTKEFYTTAWIKMSGIYDLQGISNLSAMHLPSIPTERDSVSRDPHYHADLYQTRLIFASRFQTQKLGEIKSYIETDFYGGGGGNLRLRHAYISFLNWRIGQSWSVFSDPNAWPNITDFDGPATAIWLRTAQVAFTAPIDENRRFQFAFEASIADYSRYLFVDTLINPALQSWPDFTLNYNHKFERGHFQIAGILRALEYTNKGEANSRIPAAGLALSGSLHVKDQDLLIYQISGGKGIAHYMVTFQDGGYDAVPNLEGDLIAIPIFGGSFGYQHFWTSLAERNPEKSRLSSTFVYGYVQVNNPVEKPSNTLLTGHYASANLYWNILGPLNLAIEGIYGFRTDEFLSRGDNFRYQFVMEYNF